MPHVLGPPASRVSPGGETGNVTSSHRPPHGRGPERSQHSPGRETKACGGSSHDTGARRLARTCHCVPTSLERALWISAILTSVRDFSKLHKDALGPDTAPGHRVVSSRPEGWVPWMGFSQNYLQFTSLYSHNLTVIWTREEMG